MASFSTYVHIMYIFGQNQRELTVKTCFWVFINDDLKMPGYSSFIFACFLLGRFLVEDEPPEVARLR
jgi:hypothetical protein